MSSNEKFDLHSKCGFICFLESLSIPRDVELEVVAHSGLKYGSYFLELDASKQIFATELVQGGRTYRRYLFPCRNLELANKHVNRMTKWIAEYQHRNTIKDTPHAR